METIFLSDMKKPNFLSVFLMFPMRPGYLNDPGSRGLIIILFPQQVPSPPHPHPLASSTLPGIRPHSEQQFVGVKTWLATAYITIYYTHHNYWLSL